MQLYTIGINHNTAPIAIRENVAFSDNNLRHALGDLTAQNAVEAAILSTCNRTEIYVQSSEPQLIVDWLAGYHKLQLAHIQPYTYTLAHDAAVKHAFRVASGLDSMVLGEPPISVLVRTSLATSKVR